MNHPCQCCGNLTVSEAYDICPVCYWEDDPSQAECPDCAGGANGISLIEAKRNYNLYGACEERLLRYVRPPRSEEIPQRNSEE